MTRDCGGITMNTRARFQSVMAFEPVDRLPAIETFGWWDQTLARWHGEGLPKELSGHAEVSAHLGLDCHQIVWVGPLGHVDIPERLGRPQGRIRNLDEYLRVVAPEMDEIRLDRDALTQAAEAQARGEVFVTLELFGFFWFPRRLMDMEPFLMAFYDHPELVHRINADLVRFNERVMEQVCGICVPDLVTFAEDMSYNNGPLISKDCFEGFMAPYYRQLLPELRRRGVLAFVDSDGDVTDLIDWLVEVGVEGLVPLERVAGTDLAAIRRKHPRFRMIGGFDKTVMHRGETAMRTAFEGLLPVMRSGGYLPGCDHQTPPEVSLNDFRLYVSLLHEYCRRAADSQGST